MNTGIFSIHFPIQVIVKISARQNLVQEIQILF